MMASATTLTKASERAAIINMIEMKRALPLSTMKYIATSEQN